MRLRAAVGRAPAREETSSPFPISHDLCCPDVVDSIGRAISEAKELVGRIDEHIWEAELERVEGVEGELGRAIGASRETSRRTSWRQSPLPEARTLNR